MLAIQAVDVSHNAGMLPSIFCAQSVCHVKKASSEKYKLGKVQQRLREQ
jgi:hypothetical protein